MSASITTIANIFGQSEVIINNAGSGYFYFNAGAEALVYVQKGEREYPVFIYKDKIKLGRHVAPRTGAGVRALMGKMK